MSNWTWEEITADRSGSSGDLAKLFRNESTKQPGIFEHDAPPPDATILAREVVQNSWDAGLSLQKNLADEGVEAPPFEVRFVFRSLVGPDKSNVVARLGLDELAARSGTSEDRRALGLKDNDCLDEIDDPAVPLSVLQIEEYGTTGMGGPWDRGSKSSLYLALVSVGFTVKAAGSGGSYGYGKAGLIRGSAIHSVLAHTRFREDPSEPGITSRLLGMTYWGLHDRDDVSFTGFARLGDHHDGATRPWENQEADAIALEFGLPTREPDDLERLGSTFLLVDPVVGADDLLRAIERYWWPAIEDRLIDVEVVDEDGTVAVPRPRRDPVLKTFLRGYELAETKPDNSVPEEFRRDLGSYTPAGGEAHQLGTIGLVADPTGWSYPTLTALDAANPKSLVALVRGPRMVVEYYELRAHPCVRGTFIAAADIDDLLRQTEPKAHDAWRGRVDEEGIDPIAPKVANTTLRRVRQAVTDFQKTFKPPPPRQQDIRLPLFDDLFKNILEGQGPNTPPPPPADPRPIAIATSQTLEAASDTTIRLLTSVRFHLTDAVTVDEARCRLRFRFAVDEDGSIGDDCAVVLSDLPGDFAFDSSDKHGTTVVGTLDRDPTTFVLASAPYDMDWSMQFLVNAELDAAVEAEASAGTDPGDANG